MGCLPGVRCERCTARRYVLTAASSPAGGGVVVPQGIALAADAVR